MYGYTFHEQDPYKLGLEPNAIKDTLLIKSSKLKVGQVNPVCVSRTLPVYFAGVAKPHPCPEDPSNVAISLLKRVGAEPPPASDGLLECLAVFVDQWCEKFLTPLDAEEVLFEKWIEKINQPQARKEEIRRRWEESPVDDPDFTRFEYFIEVLSFIKDEPYEDWKAARAINARDDFFKAYCGPIFDAIGEQVFALPEFIKTVPVLERPEDILSELYHATGLVTNADAKCYESHFKNRIKEKLENRVYRYMASKSPRLRFLIENIISVLARDQVFKFKYVHAKIESLRCSGEMNTSLGNGLSTVLLNTFIAWVKGVVSKLRAEGDDNLGWWSIAELAPTDDDWKELGWNMVVELPPNVMEASFCGNIFDLTDLTVITDPVSALVDFGWTNKKYTKASKALREQLLRSKGLSMAHQYNGCPLLGPFGRRICELTSHVRIRKSIVETTEQYKREKLAMYIKKGLPEPKEIGDNTREMVERLYGIPVPDQLAFETSLSSLYLYCSIDFPLPTPTSWETVMSEYTTVAGESWACSLPRDTARLQGFLERFGTRTRGFNKDYFG